MANSHLTAGDSWSNHYRGFRLQVSPDRSVWWQLYNGTDRLELDPVPAEIVDDLLSVKPQGGRVHITENGDVLTRLEDASSEGYSSVYVGELDLKGELLPKDAPEYGISLRPTDLSLGDLWSSVYDGSRYSFVGENVWWKNGATNRRHHVDGEFSQDILSTLKRYKPQGGSFRVTPWGDVITLVEAHPAPGNVEEQFADLPRIIQNIIKLRKERGVEMLPIYVGTLEDTQIEVRDPQSLTDELSEAEQESLSSWAKGLGTTSTVSSTSHSAESSLENSNNESSGGSETAKPTQKSDTDSESFQFDDDPMEWVRDNIDDHQES